VLPFQAIASDQFRFFVNSVRVVGEFERKSAEYAKIPGGPRRGWIRSHHDQVYRSLCIASDDPLLEVK
jgi:hypothetical protein